MKKQAYKFFLELTSVWIGKSYSPNTPVPQINNSFF